MNLKSPYYRRYSILVFIGVANENTTNITYPLGFLIALDIAD